MATASTFAGSADRNLLFGILALQMDFISRDALIKAMHAWVLEKSKSLGQLLVEQGAMAADHRALLEPLVQKHLEMHDNDPQKSLASVSSLGSARQQLEQIVDAELHQSLAHVAANRVGEDDLFATQPPTVGEPTSMGQRFRILRPHAEGGLGKVFVARDEELRREVALKEIKDRHADDPDKRLRFLLEAEITGGLEHPGIVPVYGLGQYADGRPFYAMRFIKGDSLQDAIARFHRADTPGRDIGERTLGLRKLLGRFLDVCNAIAYAHSRGVLHRDLKPGNIMLGKYGETLVVDWGLAKPLGRAEKATESIEGPLQPSSASGSNPTQLGSAIGTPAYMPPEQAAGKLDQLGPASDVYSLGATLYCLLTGQPPFEGTDLGAVLRQVQHGEFRRPREVKDAVPAVLEAVCLKAMALKPQDRYASPRALMEDIEHWLADEPVAAYPEPWKARAGRWARRHRPAVAGGVAAIGVAAVCLAVATILLTAARENERQAKQLAEQNEKMAEQQRDKARERFELARTAVDQYYMKVSESAELKAHGLEKLRTNLLETAAEFYEKLVKEEEGDVTLEAARGVAYWRLGLLYQETGRFQQSDAAFLQSVAIWNQLSDQYPDDPRAPAALAESYRRLGWLYQKIGRKTEAEENYVRAVVLWEKLIDQYPHNSHYQDSLAWTYNDLGLWYKDNSQPRRAKEAHDKALALRAALVRAEPDNDRFRSSLAASHHNLGTIYSHGGRSDLAEKAYQQALELYKQLADKHPDRPDYQSDLAGSYYNLGFYYDRADQRAKAENAYKEALRIEEKLAGEHPTIVQYQLKLSSTYNMLAGLYKDMHRLADAETHYQKSLAIREKLYRDNPTVPEFAVELGGIYCNRGGLLVRLQDYPAATESFDKAIKLLESVLSKNDRDNEARRYLLNVYAQLGYMHRERGQKDEAEAAYRQVAQMHEKLARDNSATTEDIVRLGGAYCNFGNRLFENNKPQEAIDSYNRAVQTLETLLQKDSKNARAQVFLVNTLWSRGRTLSKSLQRHLDGLKDLDRALTLANENYRDTLRSVRAEILARSGDYRQAVIEAEHLSKNNSAGNDTLFHVASAYALASTAVKKDAQVPTAQRDLLADQYAAHAVALLSRIAARDYFNSPALREGLQSNRDLDSVRSRSDFQKLLTSLQKSKTSDN